MSMFRHHRSDAGLGLMEILLAMSMVFILATIGFVLVRNGDIAANQQASESDAQGIAMSVTQLTGTYTNFGTTNGTISVNASGYLTFSAMTNAEPTATGPGTTNIAVQLTKGDTMTGTYGAGQPGTWCIDVNGNWDTTAVVTDQGFQDGKKTCNADGTAGN
jgi:hypothetical protein